jgi:hypothetical protein
MCRAAQEVLIAVPGHPSGAGKVAIQSTACTGRIPLGINVQYQPDDFGPIGSFCIGLQQTQVRYQVFLIIWREDVRYWCLIGTRRVEKWSVHRRILTC